MNFVERGHLIKKKWEREGKERKRGRGGKAGRRGWIK